MEKGLAPALSSILHSPSSSSASRSWLGPVIWGVLLLIGIPFALRTGFNPGLLELQAPHLRSVQLVRKLETWSAVVLSKDLEALRAAREALAGAGTVGRTESVLDAWDNHAWLTAHPLPEIAWAEPTAVGEADVEQIARRAEGVAKGWERVQEKAEITAAVAALREFAAEARRLPADVAAARLSAWQVGFVEELKGMLAQFAPR